MPDQIIINVNDTIPPINQATIDLNGNAGNTYSKTQLDAWVTSGIKGTATQANAPTVYTPEDYPDGLTEIHRGFETLTSPNNWGNAVVTQAELNANDIYFVVTNGVVAKKLSPKTVADPAKIVTWTATTFASGSQTNYLGKDWVANTNTLSTDVPGTSTKWVVRLKAYENKAELLPGKNKFNKATAKSGLYTNTNVYTADANYRYSEYMPVLPNQTYVSPTAYPIRFTTYYDANYAYIAGGNSVNSSTFTTPANAAYVIISFLTTSLDAMQVEMGTVPTAYEAYKLIVSPSQIEVPDGSVTAPKIADGSVTAAKLNTDTKYELIGDVVKLNYSLATEDYLQKINGVIESNAFGFDLLDFTISPNSIITIHADIYVAVTAGAFAIAALYKDNTWVRDVIISTTATTYNLKLFIDNIDVNKLRIMTRGSTNFSKNIVTEQKFLSLQASVIGSASVDNIITVPSIIYGLNYNSSTINFTNRLYPEGVFTQTTKSGKINGSRSGIIDVKSTVSATDNVSIDISADTYSTTTKLIPFKHTLPTKPQGQLIKFHAIGDSLTDGGYPAVCEFIAKALNQNLGNIQYLSVGSALKNIAVELGGYTFTNRACHDGKGGWAISDYMRKVMLTRAKGFTLSASQLGGKVAWDSLGLGTMTLNGIAGRAYTSFVYSEATGELMRGASHGYYEADPTPELWDWIRNTCGVSSFTYAGTVYTLGATYSTADDLAQKKYILYLCENPQNPFFDLATVTASSGAYAFNYGAYINKYKTLASDGVTRLVVGTTAGTKVTNATAYDVCIPTHVSIIMSVNDQNNVSDSTKVIDDYILMGQRIANYNGSIKISMGVTRSYGVFNKALYQDIGYVTEIPVSSYNLNANTLLMNAIKNTYTSFYYLPIYYIQSVLGTSGGKVYDTFDLKQRERDNGDGLHAGTTLGYLDRAYQIISWIWSTY